MARAGSGYRRFMDGKKRTLLGELSGTVVELGSGTGPNLRYLQTGVDLIGIEPNPFMHRYFGGEARTTGLPAVQVQGLAQELPFPDESLDGVLASLVLCSVPDVDHALGEVLRVLKPGGIFVFVEHVAAPEGSWLRRFQSWARPIWRRIGDGCRPDRTTGENLLRAGFLKVDIQRFSAPVPLVSPHIAGTARK
ncbi:MAG: class I SAM-dependent methyltransferase [Gemmatimonadetes bacterium]|nr:class I SAM-dependent methyltransferase [Gemmatimonadota bacterium]NNM04004.1 class I SAM-dependent methyltransferase [Gemmatimonadota bacterium]